MDELKNAPNQFYEDSFLFINVQNICLKCI